MSFKDDASVSLLLSCEVKFKGNVLKISRAKKPKIKSEGSQYVEGATKIFVGAIPANVTQKEFQEYFEKYGPIKEMSLPLKDKLKGTVKGHGFVNYEYPFSAEIAIEKYAEHTLRAKWVS